MTETSRMTYFSRRIQPSVRKLLGKCTSWTAIRQGIGKCKVINAKTCIFLLPLIISMMHMMYYLKIYVKRDVTLNKGVNFLKHNTNFTMPQFKVCLSHVFQLNLLKDQEKRLLYNATRRSKRVLSERRNAPWWPELGDIVLRVRSLLDGHIPVHQIFKRTIVDHFQTCFEMQKSVQINATFPGGIHGIEMIINFQTYEEIPMPGSEHFTLLNIIPIMADERVPNLDNRIHISPGRFSSVRLETTVHNSTVRKSSDVKCEMENMPNTGKVVSASISPTAHFIYLQQDNSLPAKPDACILHQHHSHVTEAKLKYTKNLVTTGIRHQQMQHIRTKLISALRNRSKFDMEYRLPLIKRLKVFKPVNEDIERFLDLQYDIACEDVQVKLTDIAKPSDLPNIRGDLFNLVSTGKRFFVQQINMMTYCGKSLRSVTNDYVKNLKIFIDMMDFIQSRPRAKNEIMPIVDERFFSVFPIIRSMSVFTNRCYQLYDRAMHSGAHTRQVLSTMEFNQLLGPMIESPSSRVRSEISKFNYSVQNAMQCDVDSFPAKMPFSNRGSIYRIDRLNSTHLYIFDIYASFPRNTAELINLSSHSNHELMPVVVPSYIIGSFDHEAEWNRKILLFRHAPSAEKINTPSYVILACTISHMLDYFSVFGADTDQSFHFRNINAKYRVMADYTLFVLNGITTDYSKHGNEDDTLDKLLRDDNRACDIVAQAMAVNTAPTITLTSIYKYKRVMIRETPYSGTAQNVIQLINTAAQCTIAGKQFKTDLTGFQDYYKDKILVPFESFKYRLDKLHNLYSHLKSVKTQKFINIADHPMSIQFQLRHLQTLIDEVIGGSDEGNLAEFLSRYGTILKGALQIQLAHLRLINDRFEDTETERLQQIRTIIELEKSLRNSGSEKRFIFTSVFSLYFPNVQNGTYLLNQASECIEKKIRFLRNRYSVAEAKFRQWIQQIVYLIARSKYFVNQQKISEHFLSKNIGVVHLFYEDFNIRLNVNALVLSFKQLQSHFGGLANMYLGASVLNIVKFITMMGVLVASHRLCS